MSGLIADSRTLVDKARVEAQVGLLEYCYLKYCYLKYCYLKYC